jgi:hypothetical protein
MLSVLDESCRGTAHESPLLIGLRVRLKIGSTLTVDAEVTREALEQRWHARRGGGLHDWLEAYANHRSAIHASIARSYAMQGGGPVIIVGNEVGTLTRSADEEMARERYYHYWLLHSARGRALSWWGRMRTVVAE